MSKNFIYDKKRGKIGEQKVADFFIQQGCSVIDVSENADFQKLDIDLIVDDEFVEVKTQSSINKNNKITLELETNYGDELFVQGWFNYTESNILVFYDRVSETAYHINTNELKNIYQEYKDRKEYKKYFNIYDFDEEYKVSTLAFVDLEFLKKISKSLKIYKYNSMTA